MQNLVLLFALRSNFATISATLKPVVLPYYEVPDMVPESNNGINPGALFIYVDESDSEMIEQFDEVFGNKESAASHFPTYMVLKKVSDWNVDYYISKEDLRSFDGLSTFLQDYFDGKLIPVDEGGEGSDNGENIYDPFMRDEL